MSAGTAFEKPINLGCSSTLDKGIRLLMDDASAFEFGMLNLNVFPAKSVDYEHKIEYSLSEDHTDNSSVTKRELEDDLKVGLLSLPLQRERYSRQKGAAFNLMVTGQMGTGKSTFVNTLFASNLDDAKDPQSPSGIRSVHFRLVEQGYPLDLCLIDTPNYGGDIDNLGIWLTLSQYVEEQLKIYLFRENQPFRRNMSDPRIHCCIYFLSAATGITPLDIETMSSLYTRVNLIPVIGKSDCLSRDELSNFKTKVQNVLKAYGIKICDFLADEELRERITTMMPFSLVGSNTYYHNGSGELIRGRQYDWGLIEVENEAHCDFSVLREILMSNNMLDFIQSTESHYEKFRRYFLEKAVNAFSLGIVVSGLEELALYQKINLQNYRQYIKLESPSLQFLMERAKENFNLNVKDQEDRFREWKKALVSKQELLNDEIQQLHRKYLRLLENQSINNHDSFIRDPGYLEMETFSLQEESMSL